MLTDTQILRVVAAELQDLHSKAEFEPGQHVLQAKVHLHLTGAVEQLPAQLVTPSVSIPLDAVLALVAEKLGVKAAKLYEMIVAAAIEAHELGKPISELLECTEKALSEAKQHLAGRLDKVERRGQLRRVIRIEEAQVLSASSLAAAPKAKRRGKR